MAGRIRQGGLLNRALQEVADRSGYEAVPQERLRLLEASDVERRSLQKELDLLGWHVLDEMSGNPQEVRAQERRKMAKQARAVWAQDPQAGAAVDLKNDFTFGRGVAKPKAADEKVQDVIDEAWDDRDNKRALTTYEAQVALGTDLELQSNVFPLFFDGGDDGKVKVGLLEHDSVEGAVRDSENRLRVLHYVARKQTQEWDYDNDRVKAKVPSEDFDPNKPKVYYYASLRALDDDDKVETDDDGPPAEKKGEGYVYHIAVNRTSEQVFGTPSMRRTVKWLAAYNDFMAARVDMAQAAAAFIMKRQVKGTPNQVAKLAAKAVSRRSTLAGTSIDDPMAGALAGPRPASILTENESVKHEPFSISTNAGQAQQDAQMIRAQISAATRFPQSYYGDATNSNLATATSLELPVLKAIEARQELFEGLFRAFIDRAIQKAVDNGRLPKDLTTEERAALKKKKPESQVPGADPTHPQPPAAPGQTEPPNSATELQQSYEGQDDDEDDTERDLSYEFSMPNPLKRAVVDLIGAIANIARTFDPNNTNVELSRALLAIALGEGMEVEDPASMVERILPEGYVDPAVLAAQQQAAAMAQVGPDGQPLGPDGQPSDQFQGGTPSNFFGPESSGQYGADGQQHGPGNPYGAPGMSPKYRAKQGQMQQGYVQEARALPPAVQRRVRSRGEALDELWQSEIGSIALDMLNERTRDAA